MSAAPRQREAGFSLLEAMIGAAVLTVAMTAYVTGTLSHQSLAEDQTTRSQVLLLAEQFMERLRTDEDFAGLYDRCRINEDLAAAGTGTIFEFTSGAGAFPPTTYYADFAVANPVGVLVEVPSAPHPDTGLVVLREDITNEDFGLPADLNGDGAIDSDPRDDDYAAIPVVVHFIWPVRSRQTRELRITTWLKGER